MSISAPPCRSLGSQCRALRVTLRVGTLEDGKTSLDHEGTWLLGHTERITFGEPWSDEGDLYVYAMLHVPCRHLRDDASGSTCRLYGYRGTAPRPRRTEQPRRLGGHRFRTAGRHADGVAVPSASSHPGPCPAGARERKSLRRSALPDL